MGLPRLGGQRIAWLKAALNDEAARAMRPLVDSEATRTLLIAVSRLEEEMRTATSCELETASFEARTLVLALEVQAHARRHRIAIAPSRWAGRPPTVQFDKVFFSGRPEIGERLESVCQRRGLRVAPYSAEGVAARDGARILRGSAGAIFDLSDHQPCRIAEAYYFLGFASAVGVPTTLLAGKHHQELATDLSDHSIPIDDGPDRESLSAAIDLAICQPHRATSVARLADTLAEIEKVLSGSRRSERVMVALAQARHAVRADDPTEFGMAAEALLAAGFDRQFCLIYPRHPATYPVDGQRRVLHVTLPHLGSDRAAGAAESACVSCGFQYVRWEDAPSAASPDRVWQEIGRASLVVVDLTGLNPWVTFHLGMAHAGGRETLLLVSTDLSTPPSAPFPAIATERVHAWWDGADLYTHIVRRLTGGKAIQMT